MKLNRISFKTAFEAFCLAPEHLVASDDLWPVAGRRSLNDLRNQVVHGESFSARRYDGLGTATSHLQWWVERMILALLDWPLERSMVSPNFLRNFTDYLKRKEFQLLLFPEISKLPPTPLP